jgi:hypothetical protein
VVRNGFHCREFEEREEGGGNHLYSATVTDIPPSFRVSFSVKLSCRLQTGCNARAGHDLVFGRKTLRSGWSWDEAQNYDHPTTLGMKRNWRDMALGHTPWIVYLEVCIRLLGMVMKPSKPTKECIQVR